MDSPRRDGKQHHIVDAPAEESASTPSVMPITPE